MKDQGERTGRKQEGKPPPMGRASAAGGPSGSQAYYRKNGAKYSRRYPFEIRLKAVKLYLEEGMPALLVAQEMGVPQGTIFYWVHDYRQHGEAGLRYLPGKHPRPRLPTAVSAKITEVKQRHPSFGAKRIAQVLRRIFFLKASPETVRQHLKKSGLVRPKAKARQRPEPPPRRFESATPNQMWQSDITYFPVLGKTAYIIGFIDDHSRYITGLGVYRSQPSAYVVEVYRQWNHRGHVSTIDK